MAMMGETFAQDGYGAPDGGLSPLVQQQMQRFAQRRPQPQPQPQPVQQVHRLGVPPPPPGPFAAMARSPAPSAGTAAMQQSFNAASGGQGLGQQQGGGMFDPSNWNTSLPSGSLLGSY